MFKKSFIFSALGIGLIVFMATSTYAAFSIKGLGGFTGFTYYQATFDIAGGDNPNIATYLVGDYQVADGVLLGVNPKGKDVTVGIAGLADATVISPSLSFIMDQNGRQTANQNIKDSVSEDFGGDLDAFLNYWGLYNAYYNGELSLNNNWTPEKILITWVKLTGSFETDCNGSPETEDLVCTTIYNPKTYNCVTNEDIRNWGENGNVEYVCNEEGYPIAFNNSYSMHKNKTLDVNSPGVLGNDWDEQGDALTASIYFFDANNNGTCDPGEGCVANGTLDLHADGSFTYTPDQGFTGVDSFQYIANDGSLNSNIATVTITVN